MYVRVATADGTLRTLAFDPRTNDVVAIGDRPAGGAFANARERLAHNRAGRDGTAPDPWPAARLGTAVAVARDGALLLGKRIASYGNGAWQTPGGKPDRGERLASAAARELEEETGLRATSMRYATSQVDTMPETGVTWRTHVWVARVTGDLENREPDACAGWDWFPLVALPGPLFAIDRRTVEIIARIARSAAA